MDAEQRIQHEAEMGEAIAELLGLRAKRNGRYETSWGDKTPTGLYLTMKRIIEEDKVS